VTGALAGALHTDRLTLRTWRLDDAPAALEIYGHEDAARWLSPAMGRVSDLAAMRDLLTEWTTEAGRLAPPAGRWAIERGADHLVVGGAGLLPLPPGNDDLGLGWHLIPTAVGNGYADEVMFTLASWAFQHEVDELFAVVRPENEHDTATVRQNGMHWVGETTKYFGHQLQVYRLRQADLDRGAPSAHQPPKHD
jgi:RimJ/RimL family protein N-acetyltransferase